MAPGPLAFLININLPVLVRLSRAWWQGGMSSGEEPSSSYSTLWCLFKMGSWLRMTLIWRAGWRLSLYIHLSLSFSTIESGNPYWKGKIGTVDLLARASLDQLIFKLKNIFNLVTTQATLMRRSTVLSLPFQLMFPELVLTIFHGGGVIFRIFWLPLNWGQLHKPSEFHHR